MKMTRYIAAITVAAVVFGSQVYASPTITITAPILTFTTSTPTTSPTYAAEKSAAATLENQLNNQLGLAVNNLRTESNKSLSAYGDQKKLSRGFADANSYASQVATLQGYQGYDLFAVAGGVMIGLQAPSLNPDDYAKLADSLKTDPDLFAGVAPGVDYLNVGIHAGPVFGFFNKDLGQTMKNFYFNVKFGGNNLNMDIDSGSATVAKTTLEMKNFNFGLGVNYQLLDGTPSILWGLFKWRGLNLGSGLFVQSNTVNLTMGLSKISQNFSYDKPTSINADGTVNTTSTQATISTTPKLNLGIDTTTVTIPLEASTSIQLLWLANLNLGLGADLVFGSAKINAGADGDITLTNFNLTVPGTGITNSTKPGSFKLDAGTPSTGADILHFRIMTGMGMNLGPVKIDLPVYYYPASGVAIGITGAVVW